MIFFPWLLAISCLIYVVLTIIVIKNRGRSKQALGNSQNDPCLERAIRAHGNFVEVTPFAFIALWLMSQTSINQFVILVVGMVFLVGRISHATSLIYYEPVNNKLIFRILGMMTSFFTILFGVIIFIIYQI